MSQSRRLDIQRLKNSLKGKHETRQDSKRHQVQSSSGSESQPFTTSEQAVQYYATAVPIQKLLKKKSSPTIRTFNPKNLLPLDNPSGGTQSARNSPPPFEDNGPLSNNTHMERNGLPTPPKELSPHGSTHNFDLAPPPPNVTISTIDGLSERLFCGDHLRTILKDPILYAKFSSFLNRYKPNVAPVLTRYLETQKALKAIEYANAIADNMQALSGEQDDFEPCSAALIDGRFEARSRGAFDTLVHDALPAWVTHNLVGIVTDVMVKEITGNQLPIIRDLVVGLAEVFCLTDPSLPDNPIVYASEEFYRTTQYGRDYVIGRNCRFLQGPKTNRPGISRLKMAIDSGQECFETVLNYRRDGSPFINLLMCAPLYDNRGVVRYFIGAQVDVSGLVEDGKGIESFEKLLMEERQREEGHQNNRDSSFSAGATIKDPLKTLGELGQMLSYEESTTIQSHSRSDSLKDDASISGIGSRGMMPHRRDIQSRGGRRVLGDERLEADDSCALSFNSLSGKLPGVYQNYLLVRPAPSFRIIFVSSTLRIPGLLQSSFLSRIGGPRHVRDGIYDAFSSGVPVTAKVTWLPISRHGEDESSHGSMDDSQSINSYRNHSHTNNHSHSNNSNNVNGNSAGMIPITGKPRWLNCTPLFGSDDRVGVWMVVMVEDETRPGTLNAHRGLGQPERMGTPSRHPEPSHILPIKQEPQWAGKGNPDTQPAIQSPRTELPKETLFPKMGNGLASAKSYAEFDRAWRERAGKLVEREKNPERNLGEDEGIGMGHIRTVGPDVPADVAAASSSSPLSSPPSASKPLPRLPQGNSRTASV